MNFPMMRAQILRLQLEALIKEIHDVIRKERGPVDPLATLNADNIIDKAHYVAWHPQ